MTDSKTQAGGVMKRLLTAAELNDQQMPGEYQVDSALLREAAALIAADAQDAERYRWLRSATLDNKRIPNEDWWDSLGDTDNITFDKTIDAAITDSSRRESATTDATRSKEDK